MKGDKKKLLVILALGAVMVGIGAFTLLGGGSAPAPGPAAKKAVAKTTATTPGTAPGAAPGTDAAAADAAKNPLYAQALPQRDPFKEAELGTIKAPTVPTIPAPHTGPRPGPITPMPIPGTMQGTFPTNVGVQPELVAEPPFGYRVSGVIVGNCPAAVFTDAQGNQRLVMVGASLDGDSKVMAIERNQVTVDYRGKTLRLTLGGTPNEK